MLGNSTDGLWKVGKDKEAKESWDIMEDGESSKRETEAWFPVPSLAGTQGNLGQLAPECQALRVSLKKKMHGGSW